MDKFNQLPIEIKILIVLTLVLLTYGYVCRLLGIYFFWESKMLGWIFVVICIISLLLLRIQTKKLFGRKSTSEKIAIVFLLFILVFTAGWLVVIPQTENYRVAEKYLQTDKTILKETGKLNSIVLVPVGSISISSTSAGTTGQASLNFIVKGQLKFKDINIQLFKEEHSDWTIYKP